jgi:Transposase DDE domain
VVDADLPQFPLFPMEKYITDAIHNSLRPVTGKLTRPQQKTVEEVVRGLFTEGEPILTHLAQNPDVSAKKQAEKYSYHLGNVDLTDAVEGLALRKVVSTMRKNTVIAYDCTDINKDDAEEMENMSGVWDGSEGAGAQGYELHGVGVNGILLALRVHDDNVYCAPQTRLSVMERIVSVLGTKGIWALDRGNDSVSFYRDLRHSLNVRFIARVKNNRGVFLVKTGEYISVKDLPEGCHAVHLRGEKQNTIDPDVYLLVVKRLRKDHQPMRLLTNLGWKEFSDAQIVTMYLKRWGIENIFRSAKVCFGLEKVRVLSFQKLKNIVALIQLVLVLSAHLFRVLQKSTYMLVVALVQVYKLFLIKQSLSMNYDSFVRFLRQSLPPLVHRERAPPAQSRLFPPRVMLQLY